MKKFALIIMAACVFPGLANAGWMIDTKTSDGDARKTYIEGSTICEETDGDYAIIDMKTKQITMVDNKNKTYATATLDEMKKMTADFKAQADKAMADAMKNMPPEQQAAYKNMMGTKDSKKPAVKVQKMNEEKIAGFKSTKYQVFSDNKLVEEFWISSELPFFDNEFKQNSELVAEAAASMAGIEHSSDKAYIDAMKTGYPVKQRMLSSAGMPNMPGMPENWSTEEVKSVNKMDVTKFITVPSGYKKNSYTDMMQPQVSDKK